MSSRQLKNLLNPRENGELADLVRRAQAMGELTGALAGSLPEEFRGSVVGANSRADGELVVIARSPAWAARLRFESEKLLAAARAHGEAVTRCSVRVSHEAEPPTQA